MVDGVGLGGDVLGQTGATDLLDVPEQGDVDAVGIVDVAVGVGDGDDLRAVLLGLLDGVDGDVARAGDADRLPGERLALVLDHVEKEVDGTVTSGLGTGERAAVGEALAGEDAGPLVAETLVLAEHVADLASAGSDVTSGHVGVGADVLHELGHEALAEGHDLTVGLALGVEVGAALGTAHRQGREGVLEDLLEAQELEDGEVHGRVQAQTTLVGPDGRVELDAVAAVDLDLALVIDPGHAEDDDALRLDEALEKGVLLVLGVRFKRGLQGGQDLGGRLEELGLVGVATLELLDDFLGIGHVSLLFLTSRVSGTLPEREYVLLKGRR